MLPKWNSSYIQWITPIYCYLWNAYYIATNFIASTVIRTFLTLFLSSSKCLVSLQHPYTYIFQTLEIDLRSSGRLNAPRTSAFCAPRMWIILSSRFSFFVHNNRAYWMNGKTSAHPKHNSRINIHTNFLSFLGIHLSIAMSVPLLHSSTKPKHIFHLCVSSSILYAHIFVWRFYIDNLRI